MKKEEILKKKLKDANDFIKSIADMLNIDTEGLGYDGLTLSLDDFQEAIKILSNELQSVNRNEQEKEFCPKCKCTFVGYDTEYHYCLNIHCLHVWEK